MEDRAGKGKWKWEGKQIGVGLGVNSIISITRRLSLVKLIAESEFWNRGI